MTDDTEKNTPLATGAEIWIAVSDGEITADEAVRRRRGFESEAELARNRAIYEPPDALRRERIIAGVMAQLGPAELGPPSAGQSSPSVGSQGPRLGKWIAGGTALAAAAAALLVLWPARDSSEHRTSSFGVNITNGYEPDGVLSSSPGNGGKRSFNPGNKIEFGSDALDDPHAVTEASGLWRGQDGIEIRLECSLGGTTGRGTCTLPSNVLGVGELWICLDSKRCGASVEPLVIEPLSH